MPANAITKFGSPLSSDPILTQHSSKAASIDDDSDIAEDHFMCKVPWCFYACENMAGGYADTLLFNMGGCHHLSQAWN